MCISLPPLGECGFGTCINGSCVCFQGFSQNTEFFYAELPPSGVTTFCDYNRTAMIVVASVILILTMLHLILNLSAIENLKQLKRFAPLLLSFLLLSGSLVIRLARVDENLFGHDVVYSLILTVSMALLLMQQSIYLNKFMRYAMMTFKFQNKSKSITRLALKVQHSLAAMISATWVLIFAATSLVESQAVSFQLVQCTLSFSCIFHMAFVITGYTVFTTYISDLERVVDSPVTSHSAFTRKCKAAVPKMRLVRRFSIGGNTFTFLFSLLSLVFPGWLKFWVYIIYTNFVCFQLASLAILAAAGKLSPGRASRDKSTGSKSKSITLRTPHSEPG